MMHITEDTPPDMLSGAMDLTVHLPTGKSIKMCVERSTPMMDLLVQVTTSQRLQISNYTLEALYMAPSPEYSDRILPYKPNTPIGALDTQHIRLMAKNRQAIPKNIPPGHQPFESTFRLKVHLPRNQLYVTRVSTNVYLEHIMKKVCEEKNLDPLRYEFRHPANLDQILDPKLTLYDYQITEIYVTVKGSNSLIQSFSSNDIMALRKEEERKQMHNKTGGGVFNLIFRRGKSSTGSGSLSAENGSISPTQSDDSRSVTPPAIAPPQFRPTSLQETNNSDKPKQPQRKRRPAPKPPQIIESDKNNVEKKNGDLSSDGPLPNEERNQNKIDNSLTICHSRNSSDSSGYHETSILSDTLPRRPKSTFTNGTLEKTSEFGGSTSNLTKMAPHSKSTSSLAFPGRKKKPAPPPPPLLKAASSVTSFENPSLVVASQSPIVREEIRETFPVTTTNINPIPKPRRKKAPTPQPRTVLSDTQTETSHSTDIDFDTTSYCSYNSESDFDPAYESLNAKDISDLSKVKEVENEKENNVDDFSLNLKEIHNASKRNEDINTVSSSLPNKMSDVVDTDAVENRENRLDEHNLIEENESDVNITKKNHSIEYEKMSSPSQNKEVVLSDLVLGSSKPSVQISQTINEDSTIDENLDVVKPPEIVAVLPKTNRDSVLSIDDGNPKNHFVDSSVGDENASMTNADLNDAQSVKEVLNSFASVNEINTSNAKSLPSQQSGLKNSLTYGELNQKNSNLKKQPYSENNLEDMLIFGGPIQRWSSQDDLDRISSSSSETRNKWTVGEHRVAESTPTFNKSFSIEESNETSHSKNLGTNSSETKNTYDSPKINDSVVKLIDDTQLNSEINSEKQINVEAKIDTIVNQSKDVIDFKETITDCKGSQDTIDVNRLTVLDDTTTNEIDWHYQLPSPPKDFRDSSPVDFGNTAFEATSSTLADESVVTSPEFLEKLKSVRDSQSEIQSVTSDNTSVINESKPLLSNLSLEHLEKRKSLVYNRELATSLQVKQNETDSQEELKQIKEELSKLSDLKKKNTTETPNTIPRNSHQSNENVKNNFQSTLTNFKITTYDKPKEKFNIYEDETIYSNSDMNTSRNTPKESFNNFGSNLSRTFGKSMENIAVRRKSYENSLDDGVFKKPQEPARIRPMYTKNTKVNRSGSFSTDQNPWVPSKPVTRSKSQVAINRFKERKDSKSEEDDNLPMSKSNSLFDLQSLDVIKSIQNKLNTEKMEHKIEDTKPEIDTKPTEPRITPTKVQNISSSTINMSMTTWSERPKIPVSLKEDDDYKLGVGTNLRNSSTALDSKDVNNRVQIRSFSGNQIGPGRYSFLGESNNVSIKINGSEPISNQEGNVLIRVQDRNSTNDRNSDFPHRHSLSNISKIINQRPHSIALPSDFDISRVPVVRSVELKKPYQEIQNNSSRTYLNSTSKTTFSKEPISFNGYSSNNNRGNMNTNNENISNSNTNSAPENPVRPSPKISSTFLQSVPVVKGFRNSTDIKRNSWQYLSPNRSGTLPNKIRPDNYVTNSNVPFSQSNLKRTDSHKTVNNNNTNGDSHTNITKADRVISPVGLTRRTNWVNKTENNNIIITETKPVPPPPPPQIFKVTNGTRNIKKLEASGDLNKWDNLLESIRNHGGKKGLRSMKAS